MNLEIFEQELEVRYSTILLQIVSRVFCEKDFTLIIQTFFRGLQLYMAYLRLTSPSILSQLKFKRQTIRLNQQKN